MQNNHRAVQGQSTRALVSVSELNRAIESVRRSTAGVTRGFILAVTDRTGFGFNFFVHKGPDFSASLHVMLTDRQSAPEHSCSYQKGPLNNAFVQAYLEKSATHMRVDYVQFIQHLAARRSEWRFESWEYGQPSNSLDNDLVWRTTLWPTVRHLADHPPQCMDFIPREDKKVILDQLRGHATEGMIVLVK